MFLPTPEEPAAELELAGAGYFLPGIHALLVESRSRGQNLEDGSRWVGPLNGQVELGRLPSHSLAAFRRQLDEPVGIEVRYGGQGQHLAIEGIQSHHRSPAARGAPQRLLRRPLNVQIDSQRNVVARLRRQATQHLLDAPPRVHLQQQAAILPAQLPFQKPLHAGPSDLGIHPVELAFLEQPQAAGVHVSQIPQQMARATALRVFPLSLHRQVDAGVQGLQFRQPEHRFPRQALG